MKTVRTVRPAVERERRIPLGLEEFELREGEVRTPFCAFFPLTREIAADWFANHLNSSKQRTLNDGNIAVLLRLQRDDLWMDYKAEVVFDTRWEIRNGQHVLATLIRPEAVLDGFIIKLLFNLPPNVCDSWDLVRKRSAADEMKIRGIDENRYALSKAAKILWQYLKGFYDGMGYLHDRSTEKIAVAPEAVKCVEQNRDLRECILPMAPYFRGKLFSTAAVHAGLCILRRFDRKQADFFFGRLNDGLGLTRKDDPIYALRNRFLAMQDDNRMRNGETMALMFKAWNLYRANQKVTGTLRMGRNEPFPLLEPMEAPDEPRSSRVH